MCIFINCFFIDICLWIFIVILFRKFNLVYYYNVKFMVFDGAFFYKIYLSSCLNG